MNLPLMLIGGGLIYLFVNKSSTKTKVKNSPSNIIGSKEIGYVIQNCKLTIYDPDVAFEYAFEKGKQLTISKSLSVTKLKIELFGDCFSTFDKRKCLLSSNDNAQFIYELIRHGYSGAYSEGTSTMQIISAMLKDIIDQVKKEFKDIDTSDWSTQVIQEGK